MLLAEKGTPRHRADVEINVFEQLEISSRRSLREQERAQKSGKLRRQIKRQQRALEKLEALEAKNPALAQARSVLLAKPKVKFSRRKEVRTALTMVTSAGIFTTIALPAYAFSPAESAAAGFITTNAADVASNEDTQNLTNAAAKSFIIDRLNVSTTNADELRRQQLANSYNSYSGPTAADFVKNPPYSKLDGQSIMKVAAKYVGTPYVFGGENPNGFDCSGYIRFVFAQFGLDLPHAVSAQARRGIIIHQEDALPGDLIIFNGLGHSGIYAGGGMMYHAPRRGDYVKLAAIWTSNYYVVRLGTK